MRHDPVWKATICPENGRKNFDVPSESPVVDLSDRQIGAEIVAACRSGDRDAFRALYDFYKTRVYSIALYFFHGDQAAASDVTQQVFLANFAGTLCSPPGYTDWLSMPAWTRPGPANQRPRARTGPGWNRSLDLARRSRTTSERRWQTSVRVAVAALPPKFRIAVLLRYFEDLSYQEMAKALHCSMGTVASRLSRGHRILAERLKSLMETKG